MSEAIKHQAARMILDTYKREPKAIWPPPGAPPSGYAFLLDKATEEQLAKEVMELPDVYSGVLSRLVQRDGVRAVFKSMLGFPVIWDAPKFEFARALR